MALSPKQLAFIDAYFANGFNGTQAAIKAGYKANSANEQAARMLAKDSIKQEVELRQAEIKKRTTVTVQEIVEDLKTIRDYAIAKHTKTKTMTDAKHALKALELLGKTIGAYTDRQEVAVTSIKVVRQDEDGNESELTINPND